MCLVIRKSTGNFVGWMRGPKHLGSTYMYSCSYCHASMFDSMRWRASFGERDLRLGGSQILRGGFGFLFLLSHFYLWPCSFHGYGGILHGRCLKVMVALVDWFRLGYMMVVD